MQIGRKIYYEKSNGVVIWDKGEMDGAVEETTFEQDKVTTPVLSLLPTEAIGIKQLAYGELQEQFASSKGFIIDPTTEDVVFVR